MRFACNSSFNCSSGRDERGWRCPKRQSIVSQCPRHGIRRVVRAFVEESVVEVARSGVDGAPRRPCVRLGAGWLEEADARTPVLLRPSPRPSDRIGGEGSSHGGHHFDLSECQIDLHTQVAWVDRPHRHGRWRRRRSGCLSPVLVRGAPVAVAKRACATVGYEGGGHMPLRSMGWTRRSCGSSSGESSIPWRTERYPMSFGGKTVAPDGPCLPGASIPYPGERPEPLCTFSSLFVHTGGSGV